MQKERKKQRGQENRQRAEQEKKERIHQRMQEGSKEGADRKDGKQEFHPVVKEIDENIRQYEQLFAQCSDIKMRKMLLGKEMNVRCMVAYIETSVGNMILEQSTLGKTLNRLCQIPSETVLSCVAQNSLGISDAAPMETIEDAAAGMLAGDAILFVDGYDKALKIPDKGYPNMGVTKTDSEKVIRGSNEGFAESVKVNTALIRKRIRSPRVKVVEKKIGIRSQTNVDLVYVEGLADPGLLKSIEARLDAFEIDGILDSGSIEQLTEEDWLSPFPQFQTTLRPDRAAMSILEGRIVLLVDNSPSALILPTDYNSFIQTSDDYYNRWEIASFTRLLRYAAAFLAMVLPGFYLAVTNFHTQILPTSLLLSFAASRQGVPFPGLVEILLMELSFELLREAGIRLPGAMGNTIGIVGGLIIGQAAVDANIVSAMVVIVVAMTALCSFAIPNEEFATAFRLLKFAFIFLCAFLGFYGFLLGLLFVLIHLSHLESFGIPYMTPFVDAARDMQGERDSLIRPPAWALNRRPIYANPKERIRLRRRRRT